MWQVKFTNKGSDENRLTDLEKDGLRYDRQSERKADRVGKKIKIPPQISLIQVDNLEKSELMQKGTSIFWENKSTFFILLNLEAGPKLQIESTESQKKQEG